MALPTKITTAADAEAIEAALATDTKQAKLAEWDRKCAAKALAALETAVKALGDVRPNSQAGREIKRYMGVINSGIVPILRQASASPVSDPTTLTV